MKPTLPFFSAATLLMVKPLSSSLSIQGYAGLINRLNAQLMNECDITFSFNNQFDNHVRGYDYNNERARNTGLCFWTRRTS